ncbi:fasciclin domain-containing protein [Variovorax sp. YR216]|uniref:fasciclin domain-containing protein n=1 Tax=Variovorax sp. YR216 TaxID=1882828 RepID=UPI000895CA04|nr:fasciclin domain-containing protein [Variovorax sp. YR216]SEB14472.1 Uncaracterized surface protein containing fasciclin (FAS1) repeats [Variovorax sp. YR216]
MKISLTRRAILIGSLGGSVALAGCGGGGGNQWLGAFAQPNIAQVVASRSDLSVLSEAISKADLTSTLSAGGPYTLFAPNNDAFAALLGELGTTKDALFADKALLAAVLKYHVLNAAVRQADIPSGKAIEPVGGGFFKIETQGSSARITDGRNRVTNIIATDITAQNGVVHVIDRVLLPANKNIVQTAQGVPSLSILVEAVVAADLVATLQGPGPFTVFAPSNDAFVALLSELGITKDALLADKALLTKVLTYHVLPKRVLKAEIPLNSPIPTVQGQSITINSSLQIIDQRGRTSGISATDIFNTNGVVHLIDKVLLPS